MTSKRISEIVKILHDRMVQAVANGALRPGDRLPSTRKTAAELGVDPRAVAAAYRLLSEIGLVTVTQRSGVYLSANVLTGERNSVPSDQWLADALVAGVMHGLTAADFGDEVDAAIRNKTRRVVVIAETVDQTKGIARELRDAFGLESTGVLAAEMGNEKPGPRSVMRAHVLVSTEGFAESVGELARLHKKKAVVVNVRPDLIGEDWTELLKQPVFLIGMDARFLEQVRTFFEGFPGSDNIVPLVADRDDLSVIPADSPTYITEAARTYLGKTRLPGVLIAPKRIFARETVKELVELVIAA